MATNRMMTDAEQTRIESIDEGARLRIWSGSQVITAGANYNFYSALNFPIGIAQHVKFYIGATGTSAPNIIRIIDSGTWYSGDDVSIDSTLNTFSVRNDLSTSITVISIYMYLN